MNTGLNHNQRIIKGVPAATRSRAFFLWLCLLGLYFLLVSGAADHGPVMAAEGASMMSADNRLDPRPLPAVNALLRYHP